MRIVVTGAAGLVGRQAVLELAAHGHEVVAVDRAPPAGVDGRAVALDLTEAGAIRPVLRGADAVIHLARVRFPYAAQGYDRVRRVWRKPDPMGDAARLGDNVAMTYNLLAAAAAERVARVVMASSLAIYGLYYPSHPLLPEHLPIDEDHPRRPEDAYGITKLVGEALADGFVTGGGITQIASLRFPGVTPADHAGLRAKRADPLERGIGGLWTYIDVRDAAAACRLAVERALDGHQAFNLCAPTTFMDVPTPELLRRHLPEVTDLRTADSGCWAGYDTGKARSRLGFEARYLVEDA